ncbi:adhesion G protein-coupled receptor E2-like [Protopterus annectens]|uniref:adhesion G protein-coupled receptor E2-like n=1 Tax=Protopterus annectens TaxID=7888 RepID=UPI001CFBBE88|nr:adhesion G protein-coupled receptor E2-like [Protopterus annectens]
MPSKLLLTVSALAYDKDSRQCTDWLSDLAFLRLPIQHSDMQCGDVDECNTTGICGNFSVCINTEGNYTCTCQQGFQSKSGKDNFTDVVTSGCVDVDECNTTEICGNFSICINTEGSYTCTCQQGFQSKSGKDNFTDVATSGCVDVDECNRMGICENFAVCINTEGNYTCTCQQGFQSKSGKDNVTDVATSGCVDLTLTLASLSTAQKRALQNSFEDEEDESDPDE